MSLTAATMMNPSTEHEVISGGSTLSIASGRGFRRPWVSDHCSNTPVRFPAGRWNRVRTTNGRVDVPHDDHMDAP